MTFNHNSLIHDLGLSNTIEIMNWLSKEEIEKLKDDREFAEVPSCSSYFKPDKLGKLIWISGLGF